MQCNIDSRGKAARLMIGLFMTIVGIVAIVLHMTQALGAQPADWPLYVGMACVLAGGFGVFEGWAGWCVVRAMGFKTRV